MPRTALLVVDVLQAIFDLPLPLHRPGPFLEEVRGLLGRARQAGVPVFHVMHRGAPGSRMAEGSPGRRFHELAAPAPGEVVIDKEHPDAFQGTRLEVALRARGVDEIVVCGFATEACIDTTVRSAYARGFAVVLASGAHTTTRNDVLEADQIIAHHEFVLGRFATVRPAGEIGFTSGTEAGDADARSIEHAYDRWAASYDEDANATRDLDARVLRGLLPELPGRRVLELGCGTGKNTLVLAGGASVVAADFSAGMMARARAKVAATDAENVSFVRLDARDTLPFRDASFDVVAVDLVLEHIAELGRPLQEMARVLRPGGIALLVELHPYRQLEGKQARFRESGGGAVFLVPAFLHTVSELVGAALRAGLVLETLGEWSDAEETTPRLVSLTLRRA